MVMMFFLKFNHLFHQEFDRSPSRKRVQAIEDEAQTEHPRELLLAAPPLLLTLGLPFLTLGLLLITLGPLLITLGLPLLTLGLLLITGLFLLNLFLGLIITTILPLKPE